METYLYFRVAAENAVAFPASALTAIDADDDKVVMYFSNQRDSDNAINKVDVTCAADGSAGLVKNIATAITNANASKKGRVVTIADSVAGVFVTGATACGTIAIDYNAAS